MLTQYPMRYLEPGNIFVFGADGRGADRNHRWEVIRTDGEKYPKKLYCQSQETGAYRWHHTNRNVTMLGVSWLTWRTA